MPNHHAIRTTWRRRWLVMRQRFVPAATFLLAAGATGWLWRSNVGLPQTVGAVEAVQFVVASPSDGVLIAASGWPGGHPQPFDMVHAGAIVASLDPRTVLAALAVSQAELARIGETLHSRRIELDFAQSERELDRASEARRLAVNLEQRRLAVLDRRVELEANRIMLAQRQAELDAIEAAGGADGFSRIERLEAGALRDEMSLRVQLGVDALEEAHAQLAAAVERVDGLPEGWPDEMESLLEPIRAELAVAEARLFELELIREALEIRAPGAGMIAMVLHRPGEAVRAGDAIMTIAAPTSRYVVAYVREEQNIRPDVGMTVELSMRTVPRQRWRAQVTRIGAQVEAVPPHLCRNPQVAEWGLPVRIELPEDSDLRPGERVDVYFDRKRTGAARARG